MIRALVAVGLEPEPEEVAETLWLTAQILRAARAESVPARTEVVPQTVPDLPQGTPPPVADPVAVPVTPAGRYQPPLPSPEPTVPLYRQEPPRADSAEDEQLPASPFRAPGVTPLPQALHLSRALRPLRRRIPSRRSRVLDLDATVQRIADQDLWLPVTRPRPEPWLDIDLWVDDSPSMVVWRPAVHALRRLLLPGRLRARPAPVPAAHCDRPGHL